MAYLNSQERDALQNELATLNFMQAKRKVRRMDGESRLAFLRNVQDVDQWVTRYELPSLGTVVTLIESNQNVGDGARKKAKFELVRVIVNPTPENKT